MLHSKQYMGIISTLWKGTRMDSLSKQQPIKVMHLWPLIVASALFLAVSTASWCSASKNTMASYYASPPFVSSAEKPAVMLIFDNSGSMHEFAYKEREVIYIYSNQNAPIAYPASYQIDDTKFASTGFVPTKTYYGYFDPKKYYIYDGTNKYFSVSTSGDWNGNFLNWLFMKRSDVGKKVLTGGKTSATDSTVLMVDRTDLASSDTIRDRGRWKVYNDKTPVTDLNGSTKYMSPYHDTWVMQFEQYDNDPENDPAEAIIYKVQSISNEGTSIECWKQAESNFVGARTFADPYRVRVKVDSTPHGIVQDSSDKLRFGLTFYDNDNGGKVNKPIGSTANNIVSSINSVYPSTWTPLAETLYTVVNYFMRGKGSEYATRYYYYESDENGYLYPDSSNTAHNNSIDPYYFNDLQKFVPCAKSFVILITDGESTQDENVPDDLKHYAGGTTVTYPSNGTDYLKHVAYYAHKEDLRDDLEGEQNLSTYTILAFGTGSGLLKETARYGGYVDVNHNGEPNNADQEQAASVSLREWDFNGDGSPDNYATAESGEDLENAILKAINSILARVSSATAASVISNTRSGEGAVYQAVFYPLFEDNLLNKTSWAGEVHALFLDPYGNMREDTNGNGVLDLKEDLIIRYEVLADSTTQVLRFKDDNGNCILESTEIYLDENGNGIIESTETTLILPPTNIKGIKYLWNTSKWLNEITDSDVITQRTYASADRKRYIFTSIDANKDGIPDSTVDFTCPTDPSDSDLTNTATVFPYLHTHTPFTSPADSMGITNTTSEIKAFKRRQTKRVVNFIRGQDQPKDTTIGTSTIPAFRSRQVDYTGGTGTAKTWRMGDIVHSTPTVVSTPAENFDLLYRDDSYQAFYSKYRDRRTVVYAGANDGMLHAFNGGFYNKKNKSFVKKLASEPEHELGSELWAYIPFNLLPHLYWLTDPNYSHVYYVDLKPRVFDARIFADDGPTGTHPGGWGTVLVCGMRLGGGVINADIDKDDILDAGDPIMRSSYFIMDITNPEVPPTVLAEFSFPEQGFTTCYPTVLVTTQPSAPAASFSQNWHLVFGSGPIDEAEGAGSAALSSFTSTKSGKIYMVNLKEIANPTGSASINTIRGDGSSAQATFSTNDAYYAALDENTIISDPISVDFDLSYSADAIYFGTMSGLLYTANRWSSATAFAIGDLVTPLTPNGYIYQCVTAGTSRSYSASVWVKNTTYSLGTIVRPKVANGYFYRCTVAGKSKMYSEPTWNTTVGGTTYDNTVRWETISPDSAEPTWSTAVGGTTTDNTVVWKTIKDAWGGKLRRIVFDDGYPEGAKTIKPLVPSTWVKDSTLIDLTNVQKGQPVMAAPSVAQDDDGRFWVFFGTGRFFTRDDAVGTRGENKQSFYGIKEPRTTTSPYSLTYDPVLLNELVNVTNAKVYETGATVTGVTAISNFNVLMNTVGSAKGWVMEFPGTGERNLGQAAVLGELVTFTTYVPSPDYCTYEGTSNLYALYYKTGTAYKKSVLGLDSNDQSGGKFSVLKSISLGKGLSVTPNLSTGQDEGSTAFVQQSTGGIATIKQINPGIVKSGYLSWEQEE